MSRGAEPGSPVVSLPGVLRRFAPYLRRQRRLIVLSSFAMVAEVGLRLLEPWPLKLILDALIPSGRPTTPGATLFGDLDPSTVVTASALLLVSVVALGAIAEYRRRIGFALVGNRVVTGCRADLFSHLQRLSLSFHGRQRTGDLITRLTGDIGRLEEVVSTAVLPLAAHVLTVLAIAVIMLVMDWRLALAAMVVLPVFWLSTSGLGRQIRQTARRERAREGETGAIAGEVLGAIRVVQSLGGESVHRDRFAARSVSGFAEGVRGRRLTARLLGAADIFTALGTALVLWLGARLVLDGQMRVGDLVVFLAYLKTMTRPIRNVAKYSGRTAKALAAAERVVEILDADPGIREAPDAAPAPRRIGVVEFENVRFAYEPGTPAIDDAGLRAEAGTVTALVGRSGAGKSTLMNLLLRLSDPQSGRITADGTEIHRFTIDSWRRAIAVVPQETTLFGLSVRENIAFGCEGVSDDAMREAARLAGAHEFIERLPNGYDTVLGERGQTLSEGQRRRLTLARAALRRSPVLIFDEPTASLDAANGRLIRNAIRSLSRERICFVITHDLRIAAEADQIVLLEGGRLVERGTHAQLLARPAGYAAMHAAHADAHDAPGVLRA